MKKFLALLMAGIMLLTFAACGGNGEEETTTNPEEITTEAPAANAEGEEATDAEEVTDAEEATEAVTDENGEEVTDEDGEVVTEKVTKEDKTEKPTKEDSKKPTKNEGPKPVSQWSKQEILDYYNKAVVATDAKAPQGQSKMVLGYGGKITADGGLGSVLGIVSKPINSALERNSSPTSNIPGYGEIKLSDLKDIKATEKNGIITVEIVSKEQTDGPEADGSAGSVGRVIGTLGNINGALEELGAEISRGRDTVSLTYTDVTVKANINAKTGIIESGRWHYLVNILVKDAEIKLIVKIPVKNLKAAVDYTVTF